LKRTILFIVSIIISGLLTAGTVQAADSKLMPLGTGLWYRTDAHDTLENSWQANANILEKMSLGPQEYFRFRKWTLDPFAVEDHFIRSTETEVWEYFVQTGEEEIVFRKGDVGSTWSYEGPDGTVMCEIIAIEEVTVPFGGPFTAYVHQKQILPDSPYWYEYIVPGLGVVKTVDHRRENPPVTLELAQAGGNGDLNGDGVVDITDLVLLKNYMAENIQHKKEYFDVPIQIADLNGDGAVDILDTALLHTTIVHGEPVMDLAGDWTGVYHTTVLGYQLADLVIEQTGNHITSTYNTSTGVSGAVVGVIDGSELYLFITQAAPCEGAFTGTAQLRDETLTFSGTGSDCAGDVEITGVFTQNDIEADPWVNLNKIKNPSGPVEGSFWARVNLPDIQSVSVITPTFEQYPLFWDTEDERWVTSVSDFPGVQLSQRFPDGIYYFDILFNDDSRGFDATIVTGTFPEVFPNISYPVHAGSIDETKDLTIRWDKWQYPGFGIWLSVDGILDVGLPGNATEYLIPAYTLDDETIYEIWLAFNNSSGFPSNKGMVSTINFWTGDGPLVYLGVEVYHTMSPAAEPGVLFHASAINPDITEARVSTPLQEPFALTPEGDGQTWSIRVMDSDEARFPDGVYSFDIDLHQRSSKDYTVTLSGDFPAQFPNITSPDNLATLDASQVINIQWDPWSPDPQEDTFVYLLIEEIDAVPGDWSLAPDGTRVWYYEGGPSVSGTSIPESFLPAGSTFQLIALFGSDFGSAGTKGTISWIFFSTQ